MTRERNIRRLALYLAACLGAAGIISTHGPAVAAGAVRALDTPAPECGIASWYGFAEQGKRTASGTRFDARKLTAAHPTLPLNTRAKVTNLGNGKSVEVLITDRGPNVAGRAIDLSERAAQTLGMKKEGLAPVKIEPLPPGGPEVALR